MNPVSASRCRLAKGGSRTPRRSVGGRSEFRRQGRRMRQWTLMKDGASAAASPGSNCPWEDPVLQQSRVNIEGALATVRLLDHDGDEIVLEVSRRLILPGLGEVLLRYLQSLFPWLHHPRPSGYGRSLATLLR